MSSISPLLHTVHWKGSFGFDRGSDEDGICHLGFGPVGFQMLLFLLSLARSPALRHCSDQQGPLAQKPDGRSRPRIATIRTSTVKRPNKQRVADIITVDIYIYIH